MEKINNREYKNKRNWPKDVYVCDFYSRQLEDIKGYLLWIVCLLTLILCALVFK